MCILIIFDFGCTLHGGRFLARTSIENKNVFVVSSCPLLRGFYNRDLNYKRFGLELSAIWRCPLLTVSVSKGSTVYIIDCMSSSKTIAIFDGWQ